MAQEPAATTSVAPPSPEAREARLKVYDRVLATVSALGLIVGGVWAVYTHSESRRKELEQKTAEAKRDAELREQAAQQKAVESQRDAALKERELQLRKQELDLLVFKERKEAYYALCDAACEIVACRDRKEVEERARGFLRLYYGRAHIIAEADPEVSAKKIAFKDRLMEYIEGDAKESNVSPFTFFASAAFDLTKACRRHVDPRSLVTASP
jgi:hypothetical protein